ncbi:transposase, IS481 family [Bordetella pertussis STO1-CHOC-0019]|nr:transposase, IS481 family [Bordetella pertussis STO1-CHOC-0019]
MRPRPDGLAPSDCAGQGAGYRGAAPQAADPSAHRPGAGRVSQHRQPRPGPRRSVAPGRPGAGRAGGASRWCAQSIRPPAICCTSTSRSWDVSSALATGSRAHTVEGAGWDFVFVAIDDHARVAFTDIHPDERFPSAVQFLKDAVAYYQRLGVTIQRLLTDNGSAFRSRAFAALCHELGIKHRFTRPYRPQTNGKAERFIQSALREWAYAHTYQNSQHRADAMKSWLHHYNWHRPHQGIGRAVPISRLNLDEYNLLTVHN